MPWGTPGCGAQGGKELAEVGSLVGEESREGSWKSSEGGSGRSAGQVLVTGQEPWPWYLAVEGTL